ncbi:hypothetical protein ACROYT_G012119 [Oculina patagonica]
MQHDVDYSVCANKPSKDQVKCKNEADKKMVKALDAIPWKDRQWGHAIARNTIATKAKVGKAVVIERFNRTLKNKMYKQFTIQGNTQYLEMLPILVKEYNNTKHSSIKMTPTEASKEKNQGIVYLNLYGDMEPLSAIPKFKVGDKVRISKYKRKVFDKGYTPNWSEEIFIVDKIQYTNPITYKLKDLNNEEIQALEVVMYYISKANLPQSVVHYYSVEVSPSSGLASPSITLTAFESRSFTTKTFFSAMSCQPIYCAVTTGAAAELL